MARVMAITGRVMPRIVKYESTRVMESRIATRVATMKKVESALSSIAVATACRSAATLSSTVLSRLIFLVMVSNQ